MLLELACHLHFATLYDIGSRTTIEIKVIGFFLHGANAAFLFLLILFHQALSAFELQISQDRPLYECRLLRSEDAAFRANPWPKCSAKFF